MAIDVAGVPRSLQDRFEILSLLGAGGFGRVFRARDRELDREVALKLLTRLDPEVLARFQREARVTAGLRHPHIASLYLHGEEGGVPFIVYEFVPGRSLKKVLATSGPLPGDRVRAWGLALADALAHAHDAGVLHRDLKPDNVLIREGDGAAVLVDFGLASDDGRGEELTRTGAAMGTVRYMAPESLFEAEITAASDQYALAATLVTSLTGQVYDLAFRSFLGRGGGESFPDPPTPWMEPLARALSWDPAGRYPDMAAFREALGETPGETPVGEPDRSGAREVDRGPEGGRTPGSMALRQPDWEALARARLPPGFATTSQGPRAPGSMSLLPPEENEAAPGNAGSWLRPLGLGGLLLLSGVLGFLGTRSPPRETLPPTTPAPPRGNPALERAGVALDEAAARLKRRPLPENPLAWYPSRKHHLEIVRGRLDPRVSLRFRRWLEAFTGWARERSWLPPGERPPVLGREAVRIAVVAATEVSVLDKIPELLVNVRLPEEGIENQAHWITEGQERLREVRQVAAPFLEERLAGALAEDPEVVGVAAVLAFRFLSPSLESWAEHLLGQSLEEDPPTAYPEAALRPVVFTVVARSTRAGALPCELRRAWLDRLLAYPWTREGGEREIGAQIRMAAREDAECSGSSVAGLELARRAALQLRDPELRQRLAYFLDSLRELGRRAMPYEGEDSPRGRAARELRHVLVGLGHTVYRTGDRRPGPE